MFTILFCLFSQDHFKNRLANILSHNFLHGKTHHRSQGYDSATIRFNANGDGNVGLKTATIPRVNDQSIYIDDLIDYAFQCASGMQYLTSRKVRKCINNICNYNP